MIEPAVGTRAAWIAELDAPLVVLASADVEARRMAGLLAAAGFRRVEGNRSSIASGLLRRAGVENLEHVVDGVRDLEQHGLELEQRD